MKRMWPVWWQMLLSTCKSSGASAQAWHTQLVLLADTMLVATFHTGCLAVRRWTRTVCNCSHYCKQAYGRDACSVMSARGIMEFGYLQDIDISLHSCHKPADACCHCSSRGMVQSQNDPASFSGRVEQLAVQHHCYPQIAAVSELLMQHGLADVSHLHALMRDLPGEPGRTSPPRSLAEHVFEELRKQGKVAELMQLGRVGLEGKLQVCYTDDKSIDLPTALTSSVSGVCTVQTLTGSPSPLWVCCRCTLGPTGRCCG